MVTNKQHGNQQNMVNQQTTWQTDKKQLCNLHKTTWQPTNNFGNQQNNIVTNQQTTWQPTKQHGNQQHVATNKTTW
jgi:hypothetical protein